MVVAEIVAVDRRLDDGADAPDPFAGIGGRQEGGELQIADPVGAAVPGPSDGCEITGRMVRVMTFQSLSISIGITGWMFRMFCVPFSGPKLKLVLFWNGTLIRLPTGFCASFASSSADISAPAGAASAHMTAQASQSLGNGSVVIVEEDLSWLERCPSAVSGGIRRRLGSRRRRSRPPPNDRPSRRRRRSDRRRRIHRSRHRRQSDRRRPNRRIAPSGSLR